MTPTYTASLDPKVQSTNIRAKKIDGFVLEIFEIVFTSFQFKDKLDKACFF